MDIEKAIKVVKEYVRILKEKPIKNVQGRLMSLLPYDKDTIKEAIKVELIFRYSRFDIVFSELISVTAVFVILRSIKFSEPAKSPISLIAVLFKLIRSRRLKFESMLKSEIAVLFAFNTCNLVAYLKGYKELT